MSEQLNQGGEHDEDQDDNSEYEQDSDDGGISINTNSWAIELSFVEAYRELELNGFSQVTTFICRERRIYSYQFSEGIQNTY